MSRFLSVDELGDVPEPSYLLEPFIIDGGITVLFGASGTFKSFIAVDWALRVATTASAIYVAAEGRGGAGKRVRAWREHGAPGELCAAWLPEPVNLLDKHDVGRLTEDINHLEWVPGLIVFDTLARCMPGGDENSAQDMGRAIGSIDQLRAEFECATLVVHHTGKQDGENERGSSALRAAADISIRAKPAGVNCVRLECAKVRDAAEFDPLVVRLLPVNGSLVAAAAAARGDVIDQAVREYLEAHPTASQRQVEKAVAGRAVDVREAYQRCVPRVPPPDAPPGKVRPTPLSLKGRVDAAPHGSEDGGW